MLKEPPPGRLGALGRSSLTSQDGSHDGGQQAPGIDGHVEDGEELLPRFELEAKKRSTGGFICRQDRRRSGPTYVVFVKLVASEGRNAGFDSSGAQSDEDEPDHGQSAAKTPPDQTRQWKGGVPHADMQLFRQVGVQA